MSGLFGVDGTFSTVTRPSAIATRSVNVPPTSIPTRMLSLHPQTCSLELTRRVKMFHHFFAAGVGGHAE
jgi:hypothetical protein